MGLFHCSVVLKWPSLKQPSLVYCLWINSFQQSNCLINWVFPQLRSHLPFFFYWFIPVLLLFLPSSFLPSFLSGSFYPPHLWLLPKASAPLSFLFLLQTVYIGNIASNPHWMLFCDSFKLTLHGLLAETLNTQSLWSLHTLIAFLPPPKTTSITKSGLKPAVTPDIKLLLSNLELSLIFHFVLNFPYSIEIIVMKEYWKMEK